VCQSLVFISQSIGGMRCRRLLHGRLVVLALKFDCAFEVCRKRYIVNICLE
jgi:hypothetical protein